MAAVPLTVTPELLRSAWQQRRHTGWPDSFEACMADPLISRLVRTQALGLAQAARSRAQRAAMPPAAAATPAPAARPPHHARPTQAALFDPKRLAAGDTDDDD